MAIPVAWPDPNPHASRVAVVGAGILGAAIAFHLALRGAKVTLFERDEPGRATSAVSFAWINSRDKHPRHYHDLNRRSLDMWSRFSRLLGAEALVTWGGEVRWAATPSGAESLLAQVEELQSWGYPIYPIESRTLADLVPDLVSGPVSAASYSPYDGHVDAVGVVNTCVQRVGAMGGRIHRRTPVVGFEIDGHGAGSSIQAVVTPAGRFACDAVVLACGPDTGEVGRLLGLEIPLHHTFGASLLTQPMPPLLGRPAVLHMPRDSEPRIHVRQLPDGRMVIQGSSPNEESLGRDDGEIARMMAAARAYLPALTPARVEEVRRGRRPIPRDGLPLIGYTKNISNLYLAVMHSGVTLAALVGEFASLEILSRTAIDLLAPYRLERFE